MRTKFLVAIIVAVLGVVGLARIVEVVEVGYEVKPGAPGYIILVIPNTQAFLLNRFGISLRVEGTVTAALALEGTGPAVIDGGPLYWVITLPGAGLAPKDGILLVSVKIPAGADPKAVVAKVVGYKIK